MGAVAGDPGTVSEVTAVPGRGPRGSLAGVSLLGVKPDHGVPAGPELASLGRKQSHVQP